MTFRTMMTVVAMMLGTLMASAEDGAFGWATCSDASGAPYALDGGWRNAEPTMKVLYASGGDDRKMISRAIQKYDIVVLDGSRGDFTVSSFIQFNHLKNKSILGRHNARLCTSWYITPEFKQMLEEAGLEDLSSSSGTGGTLSNGKTVDEERELKTRQAIIDFTGDETEAYRESGIFFFSRYDENIIIRNLVFVGPGSVDVGGRSLLENMGARIWVDHCEFIDGIDGNIDNCGYEGGTQFVTYSWNVFRYTERSFMHSYSNLVGWHHAYMQYVTLACNLWGEGCVRRMPLAEWCRLHLVNNYYCCPNNGDVIVFRGNTHALVEGNYAIDGLIYPFKAGSDDYYEFRDNIGFGQYNDVVKPGEVPLTVPYDYPLLAAAAVPETLTGEQGAGATLPNDYFNLPDEVVEPQNTVYYTVSKGESFISGTQIEKENITLTYGLAGSADYGVAVSQAIPQSDLFFFYCPGNGVNGDKEGGTFYDLSPLKDGTVTVGLKITKDKHFFILEDDTVLPAFNGITHAETFLGTYTFSVKGGSTYRLYCKSSKLCFYGFIYQWQETGTSAESYLRPDCQSNRASFVLDGRPVGRHPRPGGIRLSKGRKNLSR